MIRFRHRRANRFETRIILNNREKLITLLATILRMGIALYGLYCVVTQTAFVPADPSDDYLFTRMLGRHAIAFGASLLLIAACSEVARRQAANGGKTSNSWAVRGIGWVVAAVGIWYAMSGGSNIN